MGRILFRCWLVGVAALWLLTVGLMFRQMWLMRQYRIPYLEQRAVKLGDPGSFSVDFEVPLVSEVKCMALFFVPDLEPDRALDFVENARFRIVDASGVECFQGNFVFLRKQYWHDQEYWCQYLQWIRPGTYRLTVTGANPATDAIAPATLILAPVTEFGGIILWMLEVAAAVLSFLLAGSVLIQLKVASRR